VILGLLLRMQLRVLAASCLPIRSSVSESEVSADGYCVSAPGGGRLHQAPAPADPGEQIL
jgi:hypothetical protein